MLLCLFGERPLSGGLVVERSVRSRAVKLRLGGIMSAVRMLPAHVGVMSDLIQKSRISRFFARINLHSATLSDAGFPGCW